MNLFSRKKTPPKPPPVASPVAPPPLKPKTETVLKLDLPNVFAYKEDATRPTSLPRQLSIPGSELKPEHVRGTVLLVESDDEVRRLLFRLLQHEGFRLLTASCLAEAREILKKKPADFVLARRTCVPLNLETDIALRDVRQKSRVRIVDDFSELILGQVVDYESMSQCTLALSGLLLSLLEGAHTNARGHAQTVAKYCRLVGQRLAMRRRDLDAMTLAATLHDLGPLETEHRISDLDIEINHLQPTSLQSTLELLANIPFAYPINDLLAATTENATLPDMDTLPTAPLGARILRVVETYDTLRRNHTDQFTDENQLFDWMRRKPNGTFDLDALETLIHIRKSERAINNMAIFRETLLFVDPCPEELRLLILRLQNDDYHILTARSLTDAIHQLQTQHVTLVLTENSLQDNTTGLELLRTVKNDPALRDTLVIFHALGQDDFIKQALELGAEDWYPKPHNVEIIALKIGRILRRFRVRPAATDGVQGNLRDMPLIDMVQILCAGNRSVQIQLKHDDIKAELLIHKGQICNARHRDIEGEAAVLEVLRWQEGNFLIRSLREPPPVKITMTTDSLLLQSCIEIDHRKENSP